MSVNPDRRKSTGRLGESHAVSYLERIGYSIMDRNWRCRTGELDIVAMDGECVVFVEVRTRSSTARFGNPAESVDARKQRQVRQTALVYMREKRMGERMLRFDVIAIIAPDAAQNIELKHVINAF